MQTRCESMEISYSPTENIEMANKFMCAKCSLFCSSVRSDFQERNKKMLENSSVHFNYTYFAMERKGESMTLPEHRCRLIAHTHTRCDCSGKSSCFHIKQIQNEIQIEFAYKCRLVFNMMFLEFFIGFQSDGLK